MLLKNENMTTNKNHIKKSPTKLSLLELVDVS